ncbi:SDR family oxidoreductase [Shimia sp. R9_3]|uniref:SDR family oxidoreductase n=1 Tax=Shimia sp. R9_3 TaxID=2821113 RepID=UPI001AD957CC|nr:SDR family oxidoreductase [Shimia sp. R9_3]
MTPADTPALILGARSGIARGIAVALAKRGHPIMLAARNAQRLEADVSDISIRHSVEVSAHDFDVLDVAGHQSFLESLPMKPGIVVCAIGVLGDQEADTGDSAATRLIVESNFLAPCLFLEKVAAQMSASGRGGHIVGIGSVAGDRGRAKNYIYGSAKAGFAAYLSGLRQKYAASALHVMTVKPGFVRTAMTEGMDLPGPLTTDAEPFAERVVAAMEKGKLVYYDMRWRALMGVITHLPERFFMKTKF